MLSHGSPRFGQLIPRASDEAGPVVVGGGDACLEDLRVAPTLPTMGSPIRTLWRALANHASVSASSSGSSRPAGASSDTPGTSSCGWQRATWHSACSGRSSGASGDSRGIRP